MVPSISYLCVLLLVLDSSIRCHSFSALPSMRAIRSAKSVSSLSMGYTPLSDLLGVMPICISATSKTTTTNDPTAGMSPEEILNYVSNVGGGMCGYPDWARTLIGVGLNLSLIVFGLFTVSYVVLSGVQFALEQQVEDEVKAASKFNMGAGTGMRDAESMSSERPNQVQENGMGVTQQEANNNDGTEMNRSQRRMKQRIAENKDKK